MTNVHTLQYQMRQQQAEVSGLIVEQQKEMLGKIVALKRSQVTPHAMQHMAQHTMQHMAPHTMQHMAQHMNKLHIVCALSTLFCAVFSRAICCAFGALTARLTFHSLPLFQLAIRTEKSANPHGTKLRRVKGLSIPEDVEETIAQVHAEMQSGVHK
jgi:hypothetical protein